ncbi:cupin domain-containing protein [Rhodovulum adriaticum]|uniref:Mannose-6-phosphate isomerase-like protein (Cupin superfamily) n=1 Tax=Rhodovulum adriaticum TaxID=35804 RepID=A0A4R2NYL6_RHOAD|nr:cupin domain-containing protein [Rhodovulum adriaticum]MBK1636231.1 cupin [Rhodovulum adriaticum]TCP26515.1 mannose-6-phosphate isomerase-like protein (cupin superfamily) [Rhodovulum adriaticum]
MRPENFFSIEDATGGTPRQLAPGITTTIYTGDHAMISIVRFEPGARGVLHHHPEEQWGYCIGGSGVRIQDGEEVPIKPGDFWRTPGDMPHTMAAGPEGLTVMDVFAPPRAAYNRPGSGFAAD